MEWDKYLNFSRNRKKLAPDIARKKNRKAKVFYDTFNTPVKQIIIKYQEEKYLSNAKPDCKFNSYLSLKLLAIIRDQEPWEIIGVGKKAKLEVALDEVKKKVEDLLRKHYTDLSDQYTLIRNWSGIVEWYEYEIKGALEKRIGPQTDLSQFNIGFESYLMLKLITQLYDKQLRILPVKKSLISIIHHLSDEEVAWLKTIDSYEIKGIIGTIERYQKKIYEGIQMYYKEETECDLINEYSAICFSLFTPFLIQNIYGKHLTDIPLERDCMMGQIIENTLNQAFNQMTLMTILNEIIDVHLLFREPDLLANKYTNIILKKSKEYNEKSYIFFDELETKVIGAFPFISYSYQGKNKLGNDSQFRIYFEKSIINKSKSLRKGVKHSKTVRIDTHEYLNIPSPPIEKDYSVIVFKDSIAHLKSASRIIFQLFYWIKLVNPIVCDHFLNKLLKHSKIEKELQKEFIKTLRTDLAGTKCFANDQEIRNKIVRACRLINPGVKPTKNLANPGDSLQKDLRKIDKAFLSFVEQSFRNIYLIEPGLQFHSGTRRSKKNNKSYHQLLRDFLIAVYENC